MKYNVNYAVAYHTVDISITRRHNGRLQVLLGKKVKEVKDGVLVWRFPGGFVDPADNSAEEAAIREATEETNMKFNFIFDKLPRYIGSSKIDDERYRESDHKIITSFYEVDWLSGEDGEGPFDDMARTKWFYLNEIDEKIINQIHAPLLKMLKNAHPEEEIVDEINKVFDKAEKLGEEAKKLMNGIQKDAADFFKKFDNFFEGDSKK